MANVESISRALDISEETEIEGELVEFISRDESVETEPDVDDDFELARGTLRMVLLNGEKIMQDLMIAAKDSGHPRSYEVLAQVMKNLSDISKDLMELQKKKLELTPGELEEYQNKGSAYAGKLQDILAKLGK